MTNPPMRRSDREIKDPQEIEALLKTMKVIRLAMIDEGQPYIVPLNFGYRYEPELTFYFHSATQGRKLRIMRANPRVAFEMDTEHRLIEAETACGYGFAYASILGSGRIEFIEAPEAKRDALNVLMGSYTQRQDFTFTDQALSKVTVYKLIVETLSAKRKPFPQT